MVKTPARLAAEALANLNTFASIVTILEGGHVFGATSPAVSKIIRICQDEQQRYLRSYDRQMALAKQEDRADG